MFHDTDFSIKSRRVSPSPWPSRSLILFASSVCGDSRSTAIGVVIAFVHSVERIEPRNVTGNVRFSDSFLKKDSCCCWKGLFAPPVCLRVYHESLDLRPWSAELGESMSHLNPTTGGMAGRDRISIMNLSSNGAMPSRGSESSGKWSALSSMLEFTV